MKKKILSLVMALLILMTSAVLVIPVTAADDTWTAQDAVGYTVGDGSEASPYEISSVGHFLYFLSEITGGTAAGGKYYKLTADIDLEDKAFPLGNGTFTGTLDGNGKTISGLYITGVVDGSNPAPAMINKVNYATVKDITLKAKVYKAAGADPVVRCAVLCNEMTGSSIENVDIYTDMQYSNSAYRVYAGAFAGRGMGGSVMKNCNVYGSINVTQSVNDATIGVGGFVGDADAVKFINCNNYASVNLNLEGNSWGAVGGFVGLHGRSSAHTVTAQSCVNYGTLNIEKPSAGSSAIGGIVGYVNKVGTKDVDITGCASVGDITVDSDKNTGVHVVSGIANLNINGTYSFTNCFTSHSVLGTVANTALANDGTLAGIVGCVTDVGLETIKGASIRIMEPSGLRFNTAVSKTTYDALAAIDGISVKFGTVITPTAYVEAAKGYTKAELDAYVYAQPSITNDAYLDIAYDPSVAGWMNASFEGYDNHYFYSGAVTGINDYTLKYSGIGYMTVTLGELEFTVYSDYSADAHSRSIAYVGYRAVTDLSDTQTGVYQFAVGDTGKYSPYKSTQLEVIQKFADKYVAE